METSIETLTREFSRLFSLKEQDIRGYSPLTLAYLGDAVYEILIRTIIVERANAPVNKLHKRSSALVKASAQAAMIKVLEQKLREDELSIYRRGRNAKSYTMAKNATMTDYRMATGFEALMGYLYLKHEYERMMELVHDGLDALEKTDAGADKKA